MNPGLINDQSVKSFVYKEQEFQINSTLCAAGTEWVDPEDPTVIAENELLGAAAAIEAAAKKLEQLRPSTKPKVRGLFTEQQHSH